MSCHIFKFSATFDTLGLLRRLRAKAAVSAHWRTYGKQKRTGKGRNKADAGPFVRVNINRFDIDGEVCSEAPVSAS